MNVAWIMLDASRFVVTAMVASTVIVEQDSDLNQTKWVAKVRLNKNIFVRLKYTTISYNYGTMMRAVRAPLIIYVSF